VVIRVTLLLVACAVGQTTEPATHIVPLPSGYSAGITPKSGLLLRYSTYRRGDLHGQWELFGDGRVQHRQGTQAWKTHEQITPSKLAQLKNMVRSMDLSQTQGKHLPDDHASDLGSRVIYAPMIGPGVALHATQDHRCPAMEMFLGEAFALLATAPVER
jgi:hypothetical protein